MGAVLNEIERSQVCEMLAANDRNAEGARLRNHPVFRNTIVPYARLCGGLALAFPALKTSPSHFVVLLPLREGADANMLRIAIEENETPEEARAKIARGYEEIHGRRG